MVSSAGKGGASRTESSMYTFPKLAGRPFTALILGALMGGGLGAVAAPVTAAEPAAAPTASSANAGADEALVRRIKEEVLQELLKDGKLQDQIDLGIQRYIEKQRAAARVQQEHAAAERAKNVRPVSATRDHIYGNPDAPVSLIEYSDFECPYCKRFHDTARKLVDQSGGKVNWVYRHFPLSFHDPGAHREAIASECASALGGNDAFWKYADSIFERTTSNGNGFPASQLVPLAEQIGLDRTKFKDCLHDSKPRARVEEDLREGMAIGINGTPGNVLLNNKTREVRVIPGAVPLAAIRQDVNQLLE